MSKLLPRIIANNQAEIIDLCKRHHVAKLWVFGSVLGDKFNQDSDIDFLYEWEDNIPEYKYLDNLYSLLDSLEAILTRTVDWVGAEGLKNPYLKAEIDATKLLIYDKNFQEVSV